MLQDEFEITLTALSSMNEICHWQNKPFIEVLPHRQEYKNNGSNVRKKIQKNKRKRTTFTTEQLKVLEKTFASSKYLNSEHRRDLSKVLGLAEKCLKVWFQNKRMKEKREASESSDSSEQYSDSMSIESQIGSPELNTQSTFVNYNNDDINSYHVPQNNQYISEPNFVNPSYVHTLYYGNFTYPTENYQYSNTDNNYNKELNNGCYQNYSPQTWSSDGFDLSYLQM